MIQLDAAYVLEWVLVIVMLVVSVVFAHYRDSEG